MGSINKNRYLACNAVGAVLILLLTLSAGVPARAWHLPPGSGSTRAADRGPGIVPEEMTAGAGPAATGVVEPGISAGGAREEPLRLAGPVEPGGWETTVSRQRMRRSEAVTAPSGPPARVLWWDRHTRTVVGELRRHRVANRETLLDIARAYDLGFNEMADLYPALDPWLPPEGRELTVPSQWVLPEAHPPELVVNVAELRLYRFRRQTGVSTVETFPVGIGDLDWPTPTGTYRIADKVRHPTWVIPPSLRAKYGRTSIPPGPDNPLGDHWLGLHGTHYGIHGTDIPWSVGRLVTHGCIRLYPEDIAYLFDALALPAAVRLIYEPVKIGLRDGRVFAEVHPDVYGRIGDFRAYGFERLQASVWRHSVDREAFAHALERRSGVPVEVTSPSIARAAGGHD